MKTRVLLSVMLVAIFTVSAIATTLTRETDVEIDLKKPRDAKTQQILDTKVLASYTSGGLFVFAKNIMLGYRNQETGSFVMVQRGGNYIFENEKILADVFVRNPSGAVNIKDVVVTIGEVQGVGNDVEAKCVPDRKNKNGINKKIKFNPITDMWYKCEFTAETSESMHGEYWITAEAITLHGLVSNADNMNLYYFINPMIGISVDGDIDFGVVEAGGTALSGTLLLGNDVEMGSGVPLEFFVSGTNFYDPSSEDTLCPISNQLSLNQLSVQAEYGGIKTEFKSIPYSDYFDRSRIQPLMWGVAVTPGSEMSMVIRLKVPVPCRGQFSSGQIYFWARPKDPSPYVPNLGIGIGIDVEVAE